MSGAGATKVACASCGKILRGTATPHGYRVGRHLDTVHKVWGKAMVCGGIRRCDHRPVTA